MNSHVKIHFFRSKPVFIFFFFFVEFIECIEFIAVAFNGFRCRGYFFRFGCFKIDNNIQRSGTTQVLVNGFHAPINLGGVLKVIDKAVFYLQSRYSDNG